MTDNSTYQAMRPTIERHLHGTSFQLDDTGSSYMLVLEDCGLGIELPGQLKKGSISQVNLVASLIDAKSPELMIGILTDLVTARGILRERGYAQREEFQWYDDGAEIVYQIPTESERDLAKIIRDFDLSR